MAKVEHFISMWLIFGYLLTFTDGSIKVHGDVTVIGLFQIHEPNNGKCGPEVNIASVMTAEAVKWFFKELNTSGQLPFSIAFTDSSIKVHGDVTVIALFQIHEPSNGKCGPEVKIAPVMTAEAVKWFFKELNIFGQLSFSIGFEAKETCRLEYLAAEMANDVLYRVMNNDTIAGIVGPEYSAEAEAISKVLSSVRPDKRLVQVGFSTTAARLTADEEYPNFVRVIPNDNIQVEMMIQSMKQLEWNRIALIYEDDTYGQDAKSHLIQRSKQEDICISVTKTITVANGISIVEISDILNKVILGEDSRPTISGVVLFASSTTVKTIFQWLSSSGFSSVPIFMISEAMNMDRNVFKSITGETLPKAKGSLVLSAPYREVVEFTDHWKSIFTNATKFLQESESNPWLLEVFYSVKNCVNKDCIFSPLPEKEYKTMFGSQHLFVQYAILAAHALAKGVQLIRQNKENENMITIMKGLTIDVNADFRWRPESISDLKMTISSSGDPEKPAGVVDYQLYNFQDTGNNFFDLVRVGEQSDGRTNISFNKLRDYSGNGEKETQWPNIRKGQCVVGSLCSDCLKMNQLYESVIHEPGDIYVVGVVPIFNKDSADACGDIRTVGGYQAAESIRFAVNSVNAKSGDFAQLFPKSTIGLLILNSCNNPVEIQRKIYELHSSVIVLKDGSKLDLRDKIVGYIAELGSDVSVAVAEILTRLKFIQISYASKLPALSDKSRFPYFMRVVTPLDSQGQPIIEIVKQLDGNYMQIVYSATSYGEAGRDAVWASANQSSICVIQAIAIGEESNPMEVYDKLRKFPHARIVVIFLHTHKVLPIMSALVSQMNKGEFVFIGTPTWSFRADILDKDVSRVLLGSYSLSFEIYQDTALRSHMQNLFLTMYQQDPWSMLFFQEKYNCYYDSSFDKRQTDQCLKQNSDSNFALDYMDTHAYVATLSLLSGVDSFLSSKCSTQKHLCVDFRDNPEGLIEKIKSSRFDLEGFGSKLRVFDSNGDGNLGYRIYNIQKDTTDFNKLDYAEVGRYSLDGTFTFEKEKTVKPTDTELNSVCPNAQACSGCTEKHQEATNPVEETNDVTSYVLGSLLGCSLLFVCVLVAIIVKMHRKHNGLLRDDTDPYIRPTYDESTEQQELATCNGFEGVGYLQAIPRCSGLQNAVVSDIPTTDD